VDSLLVGEKGEQLEKDKILLKKMVRPEIRKRDPGVKHKSTFSWWWKRSFVQSLFIIIVAKNLPKSSDKPTRMHVEKASDPVEPDQVKLCLQMDIEEPCCAVGGPISGAVFIDDMRQIPLRIALWLGSADLQRAAKSRSPPGI
jgi:hypothetical protein